MPGDINYCQRCGEGLSETQIEGRTRPHCPACGYVVYLDPKVAAVVLVHQDGKLLLVKRGVEPAMGEWAFPSGYVDRGEVVEDAARREVKEETGLDVELDGFVGMYSLAGNPVVLAVYSGKVSGGELRAGHDADDAAWVDLDNLPDLPFPNDAQILQDFFSRGGV